MHTSQIDAKIISNAKITKGHYLLKLEVPSGFKDAQPGQFVHIKINDSSDPLLRRPFSIHKLTPIKSKSSHQKFYLDILYELKGRGTSLLSEKKTEDYLNILGPLGTGFDYQTQNAPNQINIIIAGGIGVAPLFFLAEKLMKLKIPATKIGGSANKFGGKNPETKTVVLIGASTNSKILCEKEFKDSDCEVSVATEDGTRGFKGKVTVLFEKKILPKIDVSSKKSSKAKSINVYACGPISMLTVLTKTCLIKKIPLQVSLEEFMGCGIGACLGCAVETKSGFQRVCHDGPVFCAEDIIWKF